MGGGLGGLEWSLSRKKINPDGISEIKERRTVERVSMRANLS